MANSSTYRIPGKLLRLGKRVKEIRNRDFQELGLTSAQADALFFILKEHRHQRASSATEVRNELQLSQSTVAGILARLEANDFIERREDTADSRRILLEPTEKSLALKDGLDESAIHTEELLLTGMTQEEKESFAKLLSVALKNIGCCTGDAHQTQEQECKQK